MGAEELVHGGLLWRHQVDDGEVNRRRTWCVVVTSTVGRRLTGAEPTGGRGGATPGRRSPGAGKEVEVAAPDRRWRPPAGKEVAEGAAPGRR